MNGCWCVHRLCIKACTSLFTVFHQHLSVWLVLVRRAHCECVLLLACFALTVFLSLTYILYVVIRMNPRKNLAHLSENVFHFVSVTINFAIGRSLLNPIFDKNRLANVHNGEWIVRRLKNACQLSRLYLVDLVVYSQLFSPHIRPK